MRGLTRLAGTWLRRLLAPAEDPRQALGDTAEQRQLALDKLRAALAAIAPVRQQLHERALQARDMIPRLEQQARDALLAGDQSLARRLLERQQHLSWQHTTLQRQLSELDAEEQRLQLIQQQLLTRCEAARAREALLAARRHAAEAHVDVSTVVDEPDEESEYLLARAEAIQSLHASDPFDDGSGLDALALAEIDHAVAAQLARLKGELERRDNDAGGR